MKELLEVVERGKAKGGEEYKIQGSGLDDAEYDDQTGITHWDPKRGMKGIDANGNPGTLSPAMILGHELAHAVEHKTNPIQFADNKRPYPPDHVDRDGNPDGQYDTPEEKRVIKNIECPCAKLLGELVRNSHQGTRNDKVPTVPTKK